MQGRSSRRRAGFTLLEILVVVTIIGLLTAFLANQLLGRLGGAQEDIARATIEKLTSALELYKLDNGRYPTTDQGLEALVREPQSEPAPRRYSPGGYVGAADIKDPWGTPYTYEAPGRNNSRGFDICSNGPDGVASRGGESDDICNYGQDDR